LFCVEVVLWKIQKQTSKWTQVEIGKENLICRMAICQLGCRSTYFYCPRKWKIAERWMGMKTTKRHRSIPDQPNRTFL